MITKQEFDLAAKQVISDLSSVLPKMIGYKRNIQGVVMNQATQKEIEDIRDSRINQGMIDKLCRLAKNEWLLSGGTESLFCAAMAVATIIKECDWGTHYLTDNGLYEMATRIHNA